MYADWAYYSASHCGVADQRDIMPKLAEATDAIDALTFSRIHAVGWERLTDFQREQIRRACCVQADFLLENADAVDGSMRRYSINGVSMEFGNDALYRVVDGVAVSNRAYALIKSTGLASLMAYPPEVDRALA